jgi:hypothetical protein
MEMHPNVATALERLDRCRKQILDANVPAERVTEILARHPLVTHCGGMVQDSGCVAYHLYPETMDALADFMRDIRAAFPDGTLGVKQAPEAQQIQYHLGNLYFCAVFAKKCSFKQKGTETVERPVYELVCE